MRHHSSGALRRSTLNPQLSTRPESATGVRQSKRRAFTLIEVLLVLAILGVIAAMVVPSLLGTQVEAYIKTTKTSIKGLENTAQQYYTSNDGEWPQSIDILLQPRTVGNTEVAPYLDKIPTDAWGTPLQYEYTAGQLKPRIWSYGPNKQEGGNDDISNQDDDQQNQQI